MPEGKNTQNRSAIKRNDQPCGNVVERKTVVRYSNYAMLRQISEGVKINKVDEDSLLNSKNEWTIFRLRVP